MPNRVTKEKLQDWANNPAGPVAVTLTQILQSIEGPDGVVFPPTFADVGYNIDKLQDGTSVALIDSVGSQANRMEPAFKTAPDGFAVNPLAELVPQIDIRLGESGKTVSILDAGHRLGDAIVRCTELQEEAQRAFLTYLEKGDASMVARLSPTSIVFGSWDSRDTQAKFPRLVQAVVRAWDVEKLTRSAQFVPVVDYSALDVFSEEERKKSEGDTKSPLAKRGFVHTPAPGVPGGVLVKGRIERQVTVNLIALRRLSGDKAGEMRSYLLGLALLAASLPFDGFLRQGCLLTLDPQSENQWLQVARSGHREPVELDYEEILTFTKRARDAFGIAKSRTVAFDKERAKKDVAESADKKAKKAGK